MSNLKVISAVALAILMTGCTTSSRYYTEERGIIEVINPEMTSSVPVTDSTVTASPPVTALADKAYVDLQESNLRKDVEKSSSQVVRSNNDMFVYMPTADAFNFNGFQLTVYAYGTLNKIASTLLDQEFSHFNVAVYTAPNEYKNPNLNLTEIRARIFTDYLLSRRVPASKISYDPNGITSVNGVSPDVGYVELIIVNDPKLQ